MSKQRRITPYTWLGAAAVTLGLGASVVGGSAAAVADTGADAGSSQSDTSEGAASDTSASSPNAPSSNGRGASRASRAAAVRANRAAAPTSEVLPVPAAATVLTPAVPAAGSTPVAVPSDELAARRPAARRTATGLGRSLRPTRVLSPASAVQAANPASALPAAAPPAPGADPSYNMASYLPTEPIVPGIKVALAVQQISDAQALLNQQTWGSGNIAAGVASIVPQLFLAEAAWSLTAWQNNMPGASQAIATTAGIPLIHQLTQVNLLVTMALPVFAEASLTGAALLLPLVNLLGAAIAPTQALVGQARSNGKVYAFVPVQMRAVTEPVVSVSVNNGPGNPMLVDTGSSGLIITRGSAPGDLGEPVATGEVTFSGDLTKSFRYTTYVTTVDFGGGAVTAPTAVNIVDEADAAAFEEFLRPAQVVGILGVGANTYGPGPDGYTIPTTSLPGELSNGFLLYQGALLGLFGVMVFGPNPLPTRVSVPGAPDAYVTVSVNDGPKQTAYSIIDSGGVYGTLPAYLIGGASSVPPNTKISVYTADGQTLLYSYNTIGTNSPTVVGDGALMNTGYIPFQQGPIYVNYAAPDRIGSTDFAIW
ncbi:MAG: PecA family PE domain-processing aspartic protease [Mycobacterium sp.]